MTSNPRPGSLSESPSPMPSTSPHPLTLAEIVTALEEDIIFGRLFPRERLVEDALMERFDAKRHLVRQALGELERMGIIVKKQNRGAFIRDYSRGEVEEIYEMRELLQARAARRMPLPAPAHVVENLHGINQRLSEALQSADLRAMYHLNNEFHDTLFGHCQNRYLAEAIRYFAWQAHPIRSFRIANPSMFARALEEHEQMIDAMRKGDRDQLERLCVEHIQPSKQAYLTTRPLAVDRDD